MKNTHRGMAVLALSTITCATAFAADSSIDLREGAVYLLTNQRTNSVIAFDRAADGTLTRVGRFLTAGSGNPTAQGADPPTDPLASQGALVLSDDGRFLFAVNAGSNEISVFKVRKDGLTLVQDRFSGGTRPISLAVKDGLLYVLNEGGTPNIVGFTIGHFGHLSRLSGSMRPLPSGMMADPAQIDFSPNGNLLIVTEKASNLIGTFPVRANGLTLAPVISPSNGLTPFGFGFDGRGHLIVSEAAGGLPEASSLSSYQLMAGGALGSISASIPNFQTAACWIAVTVDKRFVYTTNTGSGQVSSYRLRNDGRIALLDATASDTSATSLPIDMALSRDGRNLYVHQAGRQAIAVFKIENNGSLTRRAGIRGLPFAAQGIAAY
jgi:6-phosphogluconolactonase